MSLTEQQAALKRAIIDGAATPVAIGRLHIYQQAYTARLTGALRDNYGVVPRVLGDEGFDALAAGYIAAHPSAHPSIRWFGDRLPEFMAAHDDLVPHPAVVELARMERALRSAFDAPDATAMTANDLSRLAPEAWAGLVFTPMPGLQLLGMAWNVGPVWHALQGSDEPQLPEPEASDHTILVWRQQWRPRWRGLDARMAGLLQQAVSGTPFGDLCVLAAETGPEGEAAAYVAGALRGWIEDGLLAR